MTSQPEAKAATVLPEADLEDLKYFRTGYQDLGRKCDFLLKDFLREIPGNGQMPKHWHYRSLAHFNKKYSHLGMLVWASSTNSHLLLINGHRVLRIWTDVDESCWVDINDPVNSGMQVYSWGQTVAIPKGNAKKSAPFTKRIKVTQRYQMRDIAQAVRNTYGLDQSRLLLQKL